ncbi:MAG: M20/M25/M40 family metallo-hydrolase [Methanomassiliicoccales archaeon]|nr:M20/M25/M40 family metallo-hydrolase [Methanomassiliicoccales archaeon]NYT14333.1 M20/M25/M40 family metallo-hydrolase [Methanomassiliicoccales archaeon]
MDRESVIGLLSDLVTIDSVNPSLSPSHPGELELANYLKEWFEMRGIVYKEQRVKNGRSNLIARLGGGERKLLIVSHMDTVGIDTMTIPPFDPRIEGDRLYGRGSADTKGGMTATLLALEGLLGHELPGEIIFAATMDEEFEAVGVDRLVEEVTADAAIVIEPVDMKAVVAHKGFAWIEFDIGGRAAHGSDTEFGIDAIMGCGQLLGRLSELDDLISETGHELLGRASLHASQVSGGEGWSTYPAYCRLRVERRTLPDETESDIQEEIDEIISSLRNNGIDIKGRIIFFRKATEISPDEDIVHSLMSAANSLCMEIQLGGMEGWPEAGILNQSGIPSVVFGPSGCKGHEAEEFVSIESVIACSRIIKQTALEFLSLPGP